MSQVADVGPDRRYTIKQTRKPTVLEWSGDGSGMLLTADFMEPAGCRPVVHECDETLIRVPVSGNLGIETSSTDDGTLDTDLHLFSSNKAGEPVKKLKDSAGSSPQESIETSVAPGFYLVRVDYALGAGTFDAIARFAPASPRRSGQFDYSRITGLSKSVFSTTTSRFFLPMADGRKVYMEVTRPKAKGRFGVILEASPYHGTVYGRDGTRILPQPVDGKGQPLGLKRYFPPRGYAVAMMDLRGTGKSQGCLDLLGPRDASDIKIVVEWLARQPWSNGRVGMVGHSYPGSTPMLGAAKRAKGLVTIVPSAGVSHMYEHLFHNGVHWAGTYGGGIVAYNQLALFRALPPDVIPSEAMTALPVQGATGDNFGNDPQESACGVPQSPAFTGESLLSGQRVAWHEERDWRAGAAGWRGTVFLVHGVNDANARITGMEWLYRHARHNADKVWIGQWHHGSGCCPNQRGTQWTFALHAWLDKQLLQRKVDTGPTVEAFVNAEETDAAGLDARGQVLEGKSWPMRARTVSFDAVPDGSLTRGNAADGEVSFTGDAFGFAGVAEFVSAPLTADLVVAGLPELRVAWSQTLPRVHSIANVLVRSKSGDERRISNCAINPELRNGLDTMTPVVPGERMDLRLQCFTMAHRLRRGDRLVLRVSTSDFEHTPVFAFDPRVTVFTGRNATSLRLPVVTGPKLFSDTLNLNVRPRA